MAVCYKKLWKMLIDKDMIKKDLRLQTGFSRNDGWLSAKYV